MQPTHQFPDSNVHINIGQGSIPSSHGNSSVLQANAIQGGESHIQQAHGSTCPQHPHHFHHSGPHHHHDISAMQMAMATNPGAAQPSTIIFAAAPPGHQVAVPVLAGFPPAPNLQLHSGVPQPVLAMPPGPQTYPHPLGNGQAVHIHNHPGHAYLPQSNQQGSNIHVLQSSVPPPQTTAISNTSSKTQTNSQQEFTDPAIMSVSTIPPPRASLQQNGSENSFPPNIVQMNAKSADVSHQHGHKPIIPTSCNVKSVQDIEREMMGGLSAKKAPNPLQQHSGLNQYNRSQGPMHNRPVYNSNQVPRQANIGMRNNLPHQVI